MSIVIKAWAVGGVDDLHKWSAMVKRAGASFVHEEFDNAADISSWTAQVLIFDNDVPQDNEGKH